jgi:hypothetical protein
MARQRGTGGWVATSVGAWRRQRAPRTPAMRRPCSRDSDRSAARLVWARRGVFIPAERVRGNPVATVHRSRHVPWNPFTGSTPSVGWLRSRRRPTCKGIHRSRLPPPLVRTVPRHAPFAAGRHFLIDQRAHQATCNVEDLQPYVAVARQVESGRRRRAHVGPWEALPDRAVMRCRVAVHHDRTRVGCCGRQTRGCARPVTMGDRRQSGCRNRIDQRACGAVRKCSCGRPCQAFDPGP